MDEGDLLRAKAWVSFAAGAMACPDIDAKNCAKLADKLLEEFDARFNEFGDAV